MEAFRELGISEPLLQVIETEKFRVPSEIQEKAVPLILKGQDVIAGSATGSGKTLAFVTGVIQNLDGGKGIQALVIVPTRELSEQVALVFKRYSEHKNLNILPVYGGVSILPQIHSLKNTDIVIGTPGRLLDHLNRDTIDLNEVKVLILDEADRMLDMGFLNDVVEIINSCPEKRQTLLFSATISPDVVHLARRYMNNPIEVSAEAYIKPEKITQVYYDIDDKLKFSLLVHLLKNENPGLAMVFCNTRVTTEFIANNLKFSGINALEIHGGLSQEKRNRVINDFHMKRADVLVCTDIAARGLDIKGVSHIYNYNIPKDSKDYIHRIGRTARAGKEGKVINLLVGKDYENFTNVLRDDKIIIEKVDTPEIERSMIRWMPRTRFRRSFGSQGRFGDRENRQRNKFRRRH